MSAEAQQGLTPTGTIASAVDRRRVVFATVVGTTVEWYDFFIYASAAGLVFGELFFKPAGAGVSRWGSASCSVRSEHSSRAISAIASAVAACSSSRSS